MQLAALALQAEMGDHDAAASQNYFLPEHYVAQDMMDTLGVGNIRERLPSMHESQKGLSDVEAELEFLMVNIQHRNRKNFIMMYLNV